MNEKKKNTEVEGLVAVVLGVAFVGWLIAAPLSGWMQSAKDALGRFLALLVAISHVAVWLIPLAVFAGLLVALMVRLWFPRRASGMELPVLLGASRVGPLVVDLAEQPHMLVGGSTGSGKSTLLRQAIAGLVVRYDAAVLQLVLVDMKGGMEFNTFEGLPHLMCDPVSEVEDAEIQLGRVVQELERGRACCVRRT